MRFEDFARLHGLIINGSPTEGRWVRVATVDHPRKKNGAYKFLGDIAWVQNHATSIEVSTWRPETEADAPKIDRERIARQAAEFERRMQEGWHRASQRATQMLATAKPGEHSYFQYKSLPDARGLVLPDESLMVPMRHWQTNALVGAQVIRWDEGERRYEKKFLPGMRSKGAVFRLGSPQSTRTWLVEGMATGLSALEAIRLMRLRDSVVVCFSAGNLIHVAGLLKGIRIVFADHDESGAGERAAVATGLPWCMAPTVGHDANDMHRAEGIYAVAALMAGATTHVPHF